MKAFSAGLTTALASRAYKLRKGVIITRIDGTVARFTDAQRSRTIGGQTYVPGKGVRLASIAMQINSTTTRWDMTVTDGGLLDKNDLRSGIYDKARVSVFLYDEDDTAPDPADLLFGGTFGSIEVTEHGYTRIECLGPLDKSLALISYNYGPVCRRDLFDGEVRFPLGLPGCPVVSADWKYTTTVASGTGYSLNIVDPSNPNAVIGWYANGRVKVLDGPLKNKVYPIRTNSSPTALHLFRPPAVTLTPGTAVEVYPGCDKTLGPNGHLKFNANGYMFDAEPYAPGDDAIVPVFDTTAATSPIEWDTIETLTTQTNNGRTLSNEWGVSMQGGRSSLITGKQYFELVFDAFAVEGAWLGIDQGAGLKLHVVATTSTGNGDLQSNGGPGMGGSTLGVVSPAPSPGMVTRWAVNQETGDVWVGTSAGWYGGGNPETGTSPTRAFGPSATLHARAVVWNEGHQITANWAAADQSFPAPAGFATA